MSEKIEGVEIRPSTVAGPWRFIIDEGFYVEKEGK